MIDPDMPEDRDAAELTALADGTLSGRRRRLLQERVAGSPEMRAELERQRRAVSALRSVDVAAPAGLRARVEAERERARRPARRRRLALGGALVGAAAAVALALVLALPGAAGPSVVEAAELAELPATQPAPAPGSPKLLDFSAFGLPFPDWAEKFGWRATGRREDEIDGRRAVTVFYEKEGNTIGYTILSGDQLDPPSESRRAVREGTVLRHLRDGGRTIVTWPRDDKTCVLSGEGVNLDILLNLAAWKGLGKVPF